MFYTLVMICALSAVGCSQFIESDTVDHAAGADRFIAHFADAETKTYVEDGKYLRWHEGDLLSIFFGTTLNRQYKFDGETGDNAGTFTEVSADGAAGSDLGCNYALYPYRADAIFDDANSLIGTTLPAVQLYAEASFGKEANTMVAVTKSVADKYLSFKNVCGYLKLQLYGSDFVVKSIVLRGNKGEKICGSANISAVYGEQPSVAMAESAGGSITLDCGEGVELGASAQEATHFWIVLPPTLFESGFTIEVYCGSDDIFQKMTTKPITIERNVIQSMSALEVKRGGALELPGMEGEDGGELNY